MDGTGKWKIRERSRSGYAREAGRYTTWYEYQVWEGRKIIGRFETRQQAEAHIASLRAALNRALGKEE